MLTYFNLSVKMAQAEYAEEAKLIRLVENFPAIYDVNHIDNKNPIAISSMWEIISKKIKLPSMFDDFFALLSCYFLPLIDFTFSRRLLRKVEIFETKVHQL